MNIPQEAFNEVKEAYCDMYLPFEQAAGRRNLNFCSTYSVGKKLAHDILVNVRPDFAYNDFDLSVFDKFPSDCLIQIAREYSVCLYVKKGNNPLPSQSKVNATEFSFENGWYRYWWD